jgi:hypothetical protein
MTSEPAGYRDLLGADPGKLKPVKFYAYHILVNGQIKDWNRFVFDNIHDIATSKEEDDHSFAMLIDKVDRDLIYGRFVKLAKDLPDIADMKQRKENVELDPDKVIEYASHFIWDVKEEFLLGEYNNYCIKFFNTSRISEYFKEIVHLVVNIEPVPLQDVIAELLKSKTFYSASIKVPRIRSDILSKLFHSQGSFFDYLAEEESEIYIEVRQSLEKGGLARKFIEHLTKFKRDGDFKSVKIATEEAVYELIGDTLFNATINVKKRKRKVDRNDLYEKLGREAIEDRLKILSYIKLRGKKNLQDFE